LTAVVTFVIIHKRRRHHCAPLSSGATSWQYEGTMPTRIALSVVCLSGLSFSALLLLYAVSPWIEHGAIPVSGSRFYDSALFGFTGLACVYVNIRLIQGKTWAWWTTLTANALILVLAVLVFISALNPRDDYGRSESGFGIGLSVLLATPAAIATLLLILPPVRRRFALARST
jgi:hypothetical protein